MVCWVNHTQVPLWVWLMWSPQLLMSLQRGEGPHARALLIQIAQAFPQAIYYSLRTMVLCLREFAFKVVQVIAFAPLCAHRLHGQASLAQAVTQVTVQESELHWSTWGGIGCCRWNVRAPGVGGGGHFCVMYATCWCM